MAVKTTPDTARILADIAGDKRFFCQDGCVSKNLTELVDCLTNMTEEVFRRHVTPEKNDFSNWVRDVLGDDRLAGKLNTARTPWEASRIVAERIASLQKMRPLAPSLKSRA